MLAESPYIRLLDHGAVLNGSDGIVYGWSDSKAETIQLQYPNGWWFGTFFYFSIYWEFHHPN